MEAQIIINQRNLASTVAIIEQLQADNMILLRRLGVMEATVAMLEIDVARLKVADAIVGRR